MIKAVAEEVEKALEAVAVLGKAAERAKALLYHATWEASAALMELPKANVSTLRLLARLEEATRSLGSFIEEDGDGSCFEFGSVVRDAEEIRQLRDELVATSDMPAARLVTAGPA